MNNTVRLQSVGICPALPANKAQIGDRRVYNFGSMYKITNINQITKATLELTVLSPEGKEYKSKIRNTTLIVLADKNGNFIKDR